jgi:hypothetical protein
VWYCRLQEDQDGALALHTQIKLLGGPKGTWPRLASASASSGGGAPLIATTGGPGAAYELWCGQHRVAVFHSQALGAGASATALSFCRDATALVVGGGDGSLSVFDMATGQGQEVLAAGGSGVLDVVPLGCGWSQLCFTADGHVHLLKDSPSASHGREWAIRSVLTAPGAKALLVSQLVPFLFGLVVSKGQAVAQLLVFQAADGGGGAPRLVASHTLDELVGSGDSGTEKWGLDDIPRFAACFSAQRQTGLLVVENRHDEALVHACTVTLSQEQVQHEGAPGSKEVSSTYCATESVVHWWHRLPPFMCRQRLSSPYGCARR